MRRAALVDGGLAVVALILLASGHWILGIIFAAVAAVTVWLTLQLRSVR